MSADQWGVAGIVVALLIGVPAYFVINRKKTNNQSQTIGRDGRGNQAGRDINIDK